MKLSQWLNKKNRAEENKMIRIVRNSDLFDERWYVSQYQDVFKKLKDPARHYYQKGWKENRDPSDNFSTMAYLRRYPECEICPLVFEHNRNGYVDLSVCAIVKNEAPYIEEWLNYHMLVGVKRFYIYDNESTDNLKEVLAPYIAQGLVIYKYYPGEAKQMSAYNECIKEYKDVTEWLAVIDVDEFIIPTEKDNIPEFLKEFKDCPGVGINWISFDGNGYKKQPNSGVLESYTRVHYDEQFSSNHHIKSIVRPAMVEKYTNPHYAIYVDDKNAVDENGNELKGCTYRDVHPRAYTDVVSVNKIRINHYYCKSEEEYKAKLARGRALTKGGKKQFSAKALVFDDFKYDCTAYKYAEILYPDAMQRLSTKELYYKIKNLLIELKHAGKPSGLCDYIDEKWYFEQYPDAKESGMTALQHYLSIGWKEGKNPSKYFDTNFYLSRYSDIADGKTNPLLHYLTAGKGAGRLPKVGNGFLSEDDAEQLKIAVSKTDKTSKDYSLLDTSELFDKEWYVNTYLNGEDIDPIAHYLSFGWQNGCNPSKDFDTEFYLKKYKDIAKSGQNPLLHYIKHGKEEGRSPKFDGCWLKRLWKHINGTEFEDEVVASSQETTEDYKIVEKSKLFKKKWYAGKYLQGQKVNPVEHYLTEGWKIGNKPNAEFDTEKYLEENPDCKVCPLVYEYNRKEFADVAICAIMKNEGPYVKEWIDYHRLVGVRRFYIYDNESTDNMKEVLDPYIKKGIVVYEYAPESSKQRGVYNSCLKNHGDEMKWLAFIDTDEFIVPKKKDSIPEFLKAYEKYSGVSINWINFDSNGHLKKPKGGVLENYSKIYYEDGSWRNHNIKTIVRPKDVQTYFVHQGRYRDGHYAVDENKKRVGGDKYLPYVSVNKIQLNHYFCKSAEEAAAKGERGRLSLKGIGSDKSFKIKPWEINFNEYKYDYNIYKYLLKLKPEIAGRLKMKLIWMKFLNGMINFYHLFKKDEIEQFIDEKWYFEQYPEAIKSGLSAREHYLTVGWKKGYNPSKKFDTNFYLKKYPAVAEFQICPLLNYLYRGQYEGRQVLPDNNLDVAELANDEYVDLSVCAIMKNEAPYVKEWLDYHLSVGVKRFYIYDNESTDNLKEVLDPYIAKGVVVYKYYPGEARQMPAYNECIKEYKDKTEWLAVIDADEFIMPIEKDSIPEFLEEFKDCPGVGINWFCYDSNGYQNKPHGGLLESYTRVHFDDQYSSNHHIKSIVKPSMVEAYANPHYAQYKDGKNAVDENGNEMKGCLYRDTHPKAFTDVVSINKIRVNHYYCKSEEEYRAKLARGRAPIKGKKRQFSIRSLIFEDTRYDCTAYKYAERLHPMSMPRLEVKKLWYGLKNLFIYIKHWGKPCRMFDYIDEKWYFEQYPDAKESGMTALQHYLSIGWKEGKNPSKYFDTNFYLNKYKDIARAEINPLLHYITVGKNAGRLPMAGAKAVHKRMSSVTVIIPTYNRKNYMEKALNMLRAQTLEDIRFIIVDDGSDDGSADYIKEAVKDDLRFIFIENKENLGPSAARNKALDMVLSKYVGFFDIDDEIPADYYERLYEQAIKSSADIVFTCYNDVTHRIKKISKEADKYSALRNGAIWDKLYSASLLKKNGIMFAENLYTADNLFNIEAFHAAKKIVLTDEPRYSYELHNDSIGKDEKLTEKRKEDIISICTKAVNFAKGHGFDFPSRIGLYDFLKRTYDCYADDTSFQKKLQSVLRNTGVKVNVGQVMTRYNKKEHKMIEDAAYFNPEYYKRHNPQLWFSSVNPVEHYLTIGWLKGKNPSAEFDGNKYLAANEDVAKAGMNPLIHFVEHGVNEERSCEAVKSVGEEIQYALTYPIRVKEEYDRLVAEIKALENMK